METTKKQPLERHIAMFLRFLREDIERTEKGEMTVAKCLESMERTYKTVSKIKEAEGVE